MKGATDTQFYVTTAQNCCPVAENGVVVHPVILRMLENRPRMKGETARYFFEMFQLVVETVGATDAIDQLLAIDVI